MEIRTGTIEPAQPMKLEGYAIVFDKPTLIGDYEEVIQRGALDETDFSDVALFYNHDTSRIPLARTPNTLTLAVDENGLRFSAVLPNTEDGRSVYESVKRRDLRGCSFAFTTADDGDSWEGNRRTITKIDKIFECSICPFPAYSSTTVEARNKGDNEMTFTSVAESFNHYRNLTKAEIEKRAAEIEKQLTDQNADVKSLNFELEGMKQAKANIEERGGLMNNAQTLLRTITGTDAGAGNFNFVNTDDITATAEYRTAFYKSLQGRELNAMESRAMKIARAEFEKRSNEFNTSTNSAAVIPTSTLDEIISAARTQGGLLAECRAFSVPSKIAIPIATPTDKAAWHVEGAAVETEKITPTTVTFDGNEILKIFSMSVKTQTMTINAFESYLTTELQNCVMETIEYALINGTGSGQGTGLMTIFDSDNTVTTANSTTNIGYTNIVDTVSKLKRGYANGAKFAMNNHTLYSSIYNIKDGNQRPLFIADLQNQGVGKILGFDVVIDDNIADDTIIFGNFNYMAYNLPSGIVIETSRESSFTKGLIDYRAMAIADTKPILKEAFVKLVKKTS